MADIRIGDEVYIHGFVDEVRKDTVIIKNEGGYFGTVADEIMPPVQPEPLWGKTVEVGRPLADIEIVSRLRAIQKQVGGSYAIDRAIEIIEAVASAQPERNTGKWNFIGDQMFECTKCGTCYTQSQFHQMRVRITDSEFPKFCPNCGCQMERGSDE